MRKSVIIVVVFAVIIAVGGLTSYRYISTYLHNKHQEQENRNLELATGSVPIKENLPFVLIIGDSISVSYTLPVRLRLEGIANVMRPLVNCTLILEKLDRWLGQTKCAVNHFNAGLHDLEHVQHENVAPGTQKMVPVEKKTRWISIDAYRANIEKIVERLKKTDAKLVFATSTPSSWREKPCS